MNTQTKWQSYFLVFPGEVARAAGRGSATGGAGRSGEGEDGRHGADEEGEGGHPEVKGG